MGIGFISIFENSRFKLNNFKTENVTLTFKGLSFVWLYQSVFLSKFVAFHPRTVKRIVTALMPSLLFFCFSLFLPHLRTLSRESRSENCLRFGTGGPSLFVSIFVAKYNIFPRTNNGPLARKKILAKRFARAISVHYPDFEQAYVC